MSPWMTFLGLKTITVVDLYPSESDRAAAILAASFIDNYLADCIKSVLVESPDVIELFKGYAPLSSFSARISMAYALGLLTEGMKKDFHYIRKIRNHFAHHPDEASFEISPVRELCSNLSMAQATINPDGSPRRVQLPRSQYLVTIGITAVMLNNTSRDQTRRTVPKPE